MTLRINDEAPDFTAETTQGTISFHEWIGDSWVVMFSHPKDFTPVCTTELGAAAALKDDFAQRNCKLIGISVDGVSDHEAWSKDIESSQGHAVTYPLIGDPRLEVVKAYDMLPGGAGDTSEGPHAGRQRYGAVGFRYRARQEDQGDAHLSHEHGSELRRDPATPRLLPAHRLSAGGDAGQLAAG